MNKAEYEGRGIDLSLPTAYISHHQRIRRTLGKASEYSCPCGKKAYDWAYQHSGGEREIIFSTGQVGSLEYDDYSPMCRSCHNKMDGRGSVGGLIGGRKGGLKTSSIRRICSCGHLSTPGGIGRHQKRSGCEGHVDL